MHILLTGNTLFILITLGVGDLDIQIRYSNGLLHGICKLFITWELDNTSGTINLLGLNFATAKFSIEDNF